MIFLIQSTLEGEPIGAWDSEGHHTYVPDNETLKAKAIARLGTLTSTKQWPVIVSELTHKVNHQYWWSSTDSPSLGQALSDKRDDYFSAQSGSVSVDKE